MSASASDASTAAATSLRPMRGRHVTSPAASANQCPPPHPRPAPTSPAARFPEPPPTAGAAPRASPHPAAGERRRCLVAALRRPSQPTPPPGRPTSRSFPERPAALRRRRPPSSRRRARRPSARRHRAAPTPDPARSGRIPRLPGVLNPRRPPPSTTPARSVDRDQIHHLAHPNASPRPDLSVPERPRPLFFELVIFVEVPSNS
nr:serine/arginine repetitive matrix protein 1-like [Aegilops tauschii subsp. strangulata]